MPRKDLTEERTAQILDALERCVARFGLAATSLERVAEEAGVKRNILRHYVGNRDELIRLARRFVTKYRNQMAAMEAGLSEKKRIEGLLC